ncbi:hypothetical protein ABKN59_004926 [Abortiporus biennis]
MTKTRRQAKSQLAEDATDGHEHTPEPSTITVSIPEDIDIDLLSRLLPGFSLETPSEEAVLSLYRLIIDQSSDNDAVHREVEAIKAEVQKKEVELDQALQDKETATKELEVTLENVQLELKKVKEEKDEIAAARSLLEEKLSKVSNAESSSHSEVDTLKRRVEDTEREKRDLIGVVSRLKDDSAQRDEEIQTLRTNLKQARQEYQALETKLREIRSTETATKFKLDSLGQQLQLAKDEAERATSDLATKSDEFAKYRREKHAELAQLQAAHDSLSQSSRATESTLKQLQSSHTDQAHQLQQALLRVQELNGRIAELDATYSAEASGLRRLVAMMEDREAQTKTIVEGIEKEYEEINRRAERREAVFHEEIEAQRRRAEKAEKRVTELQTVLDKVDRGDFPLPSTPGTPARGLMTPARNGTPDFLTQGMMGLSPTVAMASRVQKGGKTFTEVYADYVKLQEEFARKSLEYDHMDRTLSAVLAQIEERAPVLAQQRQEYERLQEEASQLATQLSEAIAERDSTAKMARESEQKLGKSKQEIKLLNQQLDDLGRQIQTLMKELGRRQDPSIPPDEELEEDPSLKPAENIEEVITNNLVLFRSIPALQEQNQKLLKIVRELGAKMEAEEKEYRDELEKEQLEAISEAHEAIRRLQEEIDATKKSSEVTIQTYMKERDALRSTLARERSMQKTGHGGPNGHSATDSDNSIASEELAQVQNHFETYKTEMSIDSVRLREELVVAQRENGQLGAALAKANAKIEYLNDRHRMLADQTTIQSQELDNLSKRNQELYDQYTRIDIECNRVSEDLLSAKSSAETLRNECANLRAEKKIWESSQARLVDENKTLSMERSQLSDLMANVQRMHSDLERSNENDRKRLESQIQMLENQTQDLRSQLAQERDAVRHISLQKDIELKELRTRLDKSAQEYSYTREALVIAETSQKHLQEQVDQLTRQVQGNEEKLSVYERRPAGTASTAQRQDEDLSREQQLESEVAELRSSLKVAEVDLAAARAHVEQFKDISQANEAALSSLNATFDEYKTSTETQLATKESDYNAIEEKLKSTQAELTKLNEKYAELQRTFEAERAAWMSDKKTLEDAIVDITTSEKSSESDRASRESEVRQQEERAKAAEERYSREVLAHAESIKAVEDLRQQLSKSMAASRDNLAASETAQAKLATSETSWKQQKEALDKEISDLNNRCKDLTAQNNLLHQHLESVSSQAARIRQAADSSSPPTETESGEDTDTKLSELRSVVAYLRKEKEIVDLQLELSKQENLRLKTQIEHLQQTLDETRKTLSEERERAADTAASEAQHAELVERINQLTILRESNATLRGDCESHAKRARALDAKLQRLTSEVDPLKEQLRITKAELDAKDQQVKRLEDETKKWQERNTQLLTKYDRIDPAEMQSLKDEIDRLKAEIAETQKNAAESAQKAHAQYTKAVNIGRQNNDTFKRKIQGYEATIKEITAERDALKSEVEANASRKVQEAQDAKQQLDALRAEKETLEKALEQAKATATAVAASASSETDQSSVILALTQERDALLAEKTAWTASGPTSASGDNQSWEAEKASLIKSRDEALAQAKMDAQKQTESAEEIARLRHTTENFQQRIQDLMKGRNNDAERALANQQIAVDAAVQKVRSELQSATPATSEDVLKRHAEELRALEERLTKKHQEELKAALDAATSAAKQAPAGTAEDTQKAIQAAVAAKEKELKASFEEQLSQAVERGRSEVSMKLKLKDSQAVKAQNRLKEYEVAVQEWRTSGIISEEQAQKVAAAAAKAAGVHVAAKPGISNATKPAAAAATRQAAPARPGAPVAGPSNSLPQRPIGGTTIAPGTGRGRGVPRGGAVRGAAPPALSIRGASSGPSSATPATGVSIMGAAAKRAREDGDGAADDSLAKRLKPADGAANPAGTGKPVQLKRDRVHTPAPAPGPS